MIKNIVQKKRSGVVLLMSLLLMSALTASTIAVSTVIISTIRQSRNLDNFILASMTADSGIERGLAIISQGRKDQTIANTVAAIPLAQPSGTAPSFVLTANQSSAGPITVAKMEANDTIAFDLLYYSSGVLSPPADITDTDLTFSGLSANNGALQVSWAAITNSGDPAYTGRTFLTPASLVTSNTTVVHLLDNLQSELGSATPNPSYGDISGFRVQVKAVDTTTSGETVSNVSISTVSTNGFPSRISLVSTGVAGSPQAQSLKTASVLWQLPSSPFFNYVLFTESDIIQ